MCESPHGHEHLGSRYPSQPVPACSPLPLGKDRQSFKRARWIIAWCVESLLCLKAYLNYCAKHSKCCRAAPACNACVQVRPLPRLPLGSTSSQQQKYPPLPHQNHSPPYPLLVVAYGILNCHRRLSAHTHPRSVCGWSKLKSVTHENNPLTAKWHSQCYR